MNPDAVRPGPGHTGRMSNNILSGNDNETKKLRRTPDDKMIAGVCGGFAKLLGVDAALLRILLVAATLLGFGTGAVVYLVCWILMPEEEA